MSSTDQRRPVLMLQDDSGLDIEVAIAQLIGSRADRRKPRKRSLREAVLRGSEAIELPPG